MYKTTHFPYLVTLKYVFHGTVLKKQEIKAKLHAYIYVQKNFELKVVF